MLPSHQSGASWPLLANAQGRHLNFTRRCRQCQEFADVPHTLPNNLHSLSSLWLFSMWGIDIQGPLPKAPGIVKYLLVTIDYFTKWIETRPLQEIMTSKVEKFTWKHLICMYGLPYAIVTINNTQFKAQIYENFLIRLGIKHLVTSIEHPQTNGQAEAANRVILRVICTKLDKSKSIWKEELYNILQVYHCLPQTATNKTSYQLTYGTNAMIPVEVGELSTRRLLFQQQQNKENMRVDLKPPKKSKKRQGLKKKLPNFQHPGETIQRFNHEPFNLVTSCGESKVKPKKIPERESLAPTGKVPPGSQPTLTTEHTNYKSWMAKQFQEHGMPPT